VGAVARQGKIDSDIAVIAHTLIGSTSKCVPSVVAVQATFPSPGKAKYALIQAVIEIVATGCHAWLVSRLGKT
jgi:hypothetical protein